MLVYIRRSIEPVHFVCEEKGFFLRRTIDLWMRAQPKIQAASPALWGTTNDEIWKAFLHEPKIGIGARILMNSSHNNGTTDRTQKSFSNP